MGGLQASGIRLSFSDDTSQSWRLDELVRRAARSLDVDALAARTLSLPPTTPVETPWADIKCTLHEPVPAAPRHDARSVAEARVVLRSALESAVTRSLGDARSVAVMAGGGLDSAALLALAVAWARPRGARVFAVALDFAGRCDNRPYLRLLEEFLACEVVRTVPEDGRRHLERFDGVDAAPFCWPTAPFEVEMMARARALGAEYVVSGAGGDELFDGTPQALANVARGGSPVSAVRAARALRGFERPTSRTLSWVMRPLAARLAPHALRVELARRRRGSMPSWAGPALRRYVDRLHDRSIEELARNLPRGTTVDPAHMDRHRASVAWLRHQEEIVAGIQRRDPFFDRELIATVESFAPEWLLDGGMRRGLFRAAMADLLPRRLLEREDKAFFEPALIRLMDAPHGLEEMRELASVTELASLGMVEPRPFLESFNDLVAAPDKGVHWTTTWAPLGVERFLRARRALPIRDERTS